MKWCLLGLGQQVEHNDAHLKTQMYHDDAPFTQVVNRKKGTNHDKSSGRITPTPYENNQLTKVGIGCSSNSHETTSKASSNEKLKGKLEEQRNVIAAKDKKKGIFLASLS